MSPTALAEKVTEHDAIRRWRLEQLERGGYPAYDALVLSGRADVDIHLAVELLRDRYPLTTAIRILL
jgi:hypothetical protein